MSTPIRVLQVVTIMNMGGAETMIMNYYRNIDRSKVQFDFLVHRKERGAYDDEIEAMGGRIFRISPLSNVFAHIKDIRIFLKSHAEYKIIHGHVGILGYFLYKEAKKRRIPVIIAHAHNNACDLSWRWPLWQVLRFLIRTHYTQAMTCGKSAAEWTFGKKRAVDAIMLNNAIDAQQYIFNENVRQQVRKEFGWNERFVVGNIARFSPQKNHMGLLRIFKSVLENKSNALLVLVGSKNGLFEEVKRKAKEMGILHAIQFLGCRSDVPKLLQGMDVFCFPSHYEGFGIVMLEAQAAGLLTVKSDVIPSDAIAVTQLVSSCAISDSPNTWSRQLLKKYERKNTYNEIIQTGFDIRANSKMLQDYYLHQDEQS